MRWARVSQAAEDPDAVPVIGQDLEQFAFAQAFLDAAPPIGREHLGVRVELENREWKVFLKELSTDPPPVFRLGWGADFPDPDNFMNLFTSYSENNHTGWANPRYDELVERASRATDPAARQALYDRAQVILCEQDVPIVPLFVTASNHAVAQRVRGFVPSAMDLYFFDRVRAE